MREEVIADASVLIVFDKLEITALLCKLYPTVLIPKAVLGEYQGTLENCFTTIEISSTLATTLYDETSLGLGECEVIAYAKENNILALIDDKKARNTAQSINVRFTGTIGILSRLQFEKIIKNADKYAEKLKDIGFRVSDELIEFLKSKNPDN